MHDWFSLTSFGTVEPRLPTTSLLRPYSFDPNIKITAATSLLRPRPYGPAVVVLTAFHCADMQTHSAIYLFIFFPLSTPINQRTTSQFINGKGYARGASNSRREGAFARNRCLLLFLELSKQIENAFTFWISLMSFLFSRIKNHDFGQLRKAFLECF